MTVREFLEATHGMPLDAHLCVEFVQSDGGSNAEEVVSVEHEPPGEFSSFPQHWVKVKTLSQLCDLGTATVLRKALFLACHRIADGPQTYEEANTDEGWMDVYIEEAKTSLAKAEGEASQ